MSRLSKRIFLLVSLTVVASVMGSWWYLPEIKRFYWGLVIPSTGGEYHGSVVFRTVPGTTPYDKWVEQMRGRIPVFEGLVIPDIGKIALQPWPAIGEGVTGLYLRFADYQISDGRIYELPAGGQTLAQKHLFEIGVYFLGGPGHTIFFREGQQPLRVDWQAESLISVPLNVRYQHFNDSTVPLRMLAVTSFPFAINMSASESFVLNNEHRFTERFDGSPDYFERSERVAERRIQANFIPDVLTVGLEKGGNRGVGRTTMSWPMAGNTVIDMHVTEVAPKSYMKAHRHSSDAFVLNVSGKGYSLIWTGGKISDRKRIDWQKNTLFVPPSYWYHQHFNPGDSPARYLAINSPTLVRNLGLRYYDQIRNDSRDVRREWEAELESTGRDKPGLDREDSVIETR